MFHLTKTNAGDDAGVKGPLCTVGGNVNYANTTENQYGGSSVKN
jgi:hypothetical protein